MKKIETYLSYGLPVDISRSTEQDIKYNMALIPEQCDLIVALENNDYAVLRRREYPPIGELADAIYWQEMGDKKLMEAYLAKCTTVKNKYPKP